MKKIITTFLLTCFSVTLFAQQWENPFSDIHQLDSLNVWIIGGNGTIINTKDGGSSWNDYSMDTSIYFKSICFNTEQNGYILGEDNYNIKTTNGGETWNYFELDTNSYLSSMYFVDENHGWVCAGSGGLYKTTNGGNSWIHYTDTIVKVIFFDPLNGFGKTYNNMCQKMIRTWDGGLNWTEVCSLGNSVLGGGDFNFADTSFGVKVASGESTIHYSKTIDGGQSWISTENIPIGIPHVEFHNYYNAWFGRYSQIHYSNDFFETFETYQLPTDFYLANISVMGFSNGWVVGGDSDWEIGRIWKLSGVNEWLEILPAGINENTQNIVQLSTFPNPFAKTVTLKFELKNTCDVEISIYNNVGQKIHTIFSGRKTKGSHPLNWDATGLKSGIYFIKLKTHDEISSEKIIKY